MGLYEDHDMINSNEILHLDDLRGHVEGTVRIIHLRDHVEATVRTIRQQSLGLASYADPWIRRARLSDKFPQLLYRSIYRFVLFSTSLVF